MSRAAKAMTETGTRTPGIAQPDRTPTQERLCDTRARVHARCVACGARDGRLAPMSFTLGDDGAVEGHVKPGPDYEGYDGMLHGGVIATLLDAGMTNCLFSHGHCGVTADLHLRYRHPVMSAEPCVVRAWIERSSPPLFVLRAELQQDGECRVTAVGKFMPKADAG